MTRAFLGEHHVTLIRKTKINNMKKQLLTLFATALSSLAFSQTIPNGNFENWATTTIEDPQFWMCSNDENHNGNYAPANTVKTTDAYHGAYAIKLTTVLSGNDTIGAYVANGNPGGGGPPQGGIPYTEKPTGLRFYYKCNIMPGDSAIVIAQFYKTGSGMIAQYFYHITGSQSTYTLFNPTFSPALSVNPDTVIFACASSNLMSKIGVQPGSMLQIDSISFTGVASQPVNFNGDLELWQNNTRNSVIGWYADQSIQTTDKYKGTYALELVTTPPGFGNSQVQVGRCTNTHNSNNGGGPPQGGWPYSTQIDTLVFYYKYLPANFPFSTDSANVSIFWKKNGVGQGGYRIQLGYSFNYKKVSFPFNLMQMPDTVQISFESSKSPALNSYVGSDFKVDQVYFTSQKVPVTNFALPTTGCKGVTVQLSDLSTNMPTGWQWVMTGGNPSSSNAQNPTVVYNSSSVPHTYTVSLLASDSFGSTNIFISKTITINANPTISVSSATICATNSATLTASGASTFTWSSGITGTTVTLTPNSTTIYTVTGTNAFGCSNSAVGMVVVPVPPTPSLCMVTVDSTSTNNIVYWDKTLYNNVDSFIIYREVSTNTYWRIAAVSKNALSKYIDVARNIGLANGDPNIGSYRYKLQIRDTCGTYGPLGKYHNTVYIIDNHTGSFSWNTYDVEGQVNSPVTNFFLLRDDNNTNNYISLGSVSGSQTSLSDASYGTYQFVANWRVDAAGFNCTPTARLGNNSTQSAIVKSKSNISNNRTTGISTNSNIFTIYPNPSTGIYTVSMPSENAVIDVFDVSGQKVLTLEANGKNTQLNLTNLNEGIYFMEIKTSTGVLRKKITKIN